MFNQAIFLHSLLGILSVSVIFYLVGFVLSYFVNGKKANYSWLATYCNFLFGMLLTISLFAILKTNGITILVAVPILVFVLARMVFRRIVLVTDAPTINVLKPFLFYTLTLIVAYYYYASSFMPESGQLNYVWGDQEFYGRIVANLCSVGNENMRIEYLYPHRFATEPYHYGDLWTIGFAHKLSGLMPVYSGVFIAAPLLLAIASLGVAAVFDYFFTEKNNKNILYLFVLVGFVGGFSVFFPHFIFHNQVDVYASSFANYCKLLWWAAILPILFLFVASKNDDLLIWPVIIIGLGYINVLPGLMIATVLWMFILGYKRKQLKRYFVNASLGVIVLVACFLFIYIAYPRFSGFVKSSNSIGVFSLHNMLSNLKTTINIIVGGGFQLLVYTPIVLLLSLMIFSKGKSFLKHPIMHLSAFSLLFILSSLFVWGMLCSVTVEAIQFFYNVFVVVAGILALIVYVYAIIIAKKLLYKIGLVILIIVSIYGNTKYQLCVSKVPGNEKEALFNFINRTNTPKTFAHYKEEQSYLGSFFSSNTVVNIPYSILNDCLPNYSNYSLNVCFAPLDTLSKIYPFQKNNVEWAPISHYNRQIDSLHLNPDEIMLRFMQEYKISFLTVPISTKPPIKLQSLLRDSLITPEMGWKIYSCAY